MSGVGGSPGQTAVFAKKILTGVFILILFSYLIVAAALHTVGVCCEKECFERSRKTIHSVTICSQPYAFG